MEAALKYLVVPLTFAHDCTPGMRLTVVLFYCSGPGRALRPARGVQGESEGRPESGEWEGGGGTGQGERTASGHSLEMCRAALSEHN